MTERKSVLLRLDPAIYAALAHWSADELRSTNAQIEFLLREALARAGRLPAEPGHAPRRNRSPEAEPAAAGDQNDTSQSLSGATTNR
jgi:hypothetical protein